jgi:hypothetical protein
MKAAMRGWTLVVLAALVALPLRVSAGGDYIFLDGFEPFPGFAVQVPPIVLAPGERANYCYYFRAATANTIGVHRWSSTMAPGVHHLIAFATYDDNWTPVENHPPGTLTQDGCGFGASAGFAGWLYAAHQVTEELLVPDDDGAGQPLAMAIQPGQPLVVQLYVINPNGSPLTTTALLQAEGLTQGDSYTNTATYVTYNDTIAIPMGSAGTLIQQICPTPAGAKFWRLSTRTHRHAMSSRILDGNSPLVVSTDWEQPQSIVYTPPSFYPFTTGGLTYECTDTNDLGHAIHAGESEEEDEVCMGIGYFFPAVRPSICLTNIGPL